MTRGGIVPTGFLSQSLSIKKIYNTGGYFDIDGNFTFINPAHQTKGKVLMISDMCKSGETLIKIIEEYNRLSSNQIQIDIACLHYFPSLSKALMPKYYIYKLDQDAFIKYPWE